MNINPISTYATALETRNIVRDTQNRIADLQREMSTGKKADISADLGSRGAVLIGLRNDFAATQEYIQGNGVIAGRMEVMQTALGTVGEAASGVRDTVLAIGENADGAVIDRAARDAIEQVTMALNSNFSGRFLFSGTAVDTRPAMGPDERITAADPTPLELMDQAAADYFGVPLANLDAALAGATEADIDGLVAEFDQIFAGTHATYDFGAAFYAGNDERVSGQIGGEVATDYGINADDPALREVLKGLYLMHAFPEDRLNADASKHLNQLATSRLGGGTDALTQDRARLGLQQETVERVTERHEVEAGVMNTQIVEMEQADQFETAARLNSLTSQLDATFAVTARLSDLSLLNFLR